MALGWDISWSLASVLAPDGRGSRVRRVPGALKHAIPPTGVVLSTIVVVEHLSDLGTADL
jgi:hypothetical protein